MSLPSLSPTVLLVAPDPSRLPGLRQALLDAGVDPPEVAHVGPQQALQILSDVSPFRLVLLYDAPEECDALAVLPVISKVPVVVLAEHDDFNRALKALMREPSTWRSGSNWLAAGCPLCLSAR